MSQEAKQFIFETFEMLLEIGEELEVRRMIIRYLDTREFTTTDLDQAIALINKYSHKEIPAEDEEVNA